MRIEEGFCKECRKHVPLDMEGSCIFCHSTEGITPRTRHSESGIASFVIAVATPVILASSSILFLVLSGGGMLAGFIFGGYILWLMVIILLVLSIFGLLLGITGFFQKDRKQFFSTLGLLVNLINIFVVISFIVFDRITR